ncbi:MAG: leucine-rich repeat domain-containing protein [Oscillospiraceae bacterium]|nr:leucine-rich repeat domain-containing protein [Oscillospiraceae bacterium]
MSKRILTMLVLILTFIGLCSVTAAAEAEKDYAIISNSVFEAEQGNLFSTAFSVKSDNSVEALEFHLAYDKALATLSSTEIFTVGENISIKYNNKIYVVVSEIIDNAPEYYFFEVLDGCTDNHKKNLTLEKYYTDSSYEQYFTLEENIEANAAMVAYIRANYGIIVYDPEVRINGNNIGTVSVSWLPRNPHAVSGTTMFSLQFIIDDNLAATDYPNWLYVHEDKNSFADAAGGKELDLNINITPLSIYEYGDVNFDARVDTRDALLARQHALEILSLTGLKFKYADVNIDGVVSTRDALEIQQKTIGIKDHVGNRYNVYFHDIDGNICAVKSVAEGSTVLSVPAVPSPRGYIDGSWSLSSEEGVAFDFTAPVTKEVHLYAFYETVISDTMQYYVDTLRMRYNSTYNRGVTLDSVLRYGGSSATTEAEITWYYIDEENNVIGIEKNEAGQYILEQPGYNTELTLHCRIVSWKDGKLESEAELDDVEIRLKGKFSTPTKQDIVRYLREITGGDVSDSSVTGGTVEYDVILARKLTNRDIGAASSYEVRLEWYRLVNGVYEPITEINRTTSTQEHQNFMCVVTFNGVPLESDGKIYFDDVTLAPISEAEIRNYIIECISQTTPPNITDGMALWNDDDTYGATVTWVSGNADIMSVADNTVAIKPDAISGISCPLTAQVTYPTDGGAKTFELGYNISVITENSLLQPGTNMDPSLYYALLDTLDVKQLTTEHLKKTEFVALDLSKYSEPFTNGAGELCLPITDLTGITYCENLFLLNISNLNITGGLNELCTLTKLETLVARNADIESLKYGAKSALAGMINLKLVDLSHNSISNVSEILDPDTKYTKLKELYLNDNQISDISTLSNLPLLSVLEVSDNQITNIAALSSCTNLTKLSFANNQVTTLAGIENVTGLTELYAHHNKLTAVNPLTGLEGLTKLYLGNNNITDVSPLANMSELTVLFLNNNSELDNVDDLGNLGLLEVLQISGCKIRDLGTLYNLRNMRELYAEDNKIGSFMFIKQWQNLEKLLLAGNANFDESAMLSQWLAPMTNLKTLTLSGRKLNDLSFLVTTDSEGNESYKQLVRLEVANCQLPAYYVVSGDDTVIDEYEDNIAHLVNQMDSLRYLDISGNNLNIDSSSYEFSDSGPMDISQLRMLSQLYALYADNLDLGEYAATVTSAMSRLTHLSMENCGITSMECLHNSSNLEFVDLANNPIATCELGTLNTNTWKKLTHLYLDTTAVGANMVNPGNAITKMGGDSILALSLEGYSIPSAAYLPQMNNILYLNLSHTGLSDLLGVDTYEPDKAPNLYTQSIFRFTDTLQKLDLATDGVFTHDNLNMLYNELNGKDITVHLYDDETITGFDGQREFDHIIEIWNEEDRTITKSEFSLVSGSDWKADFRQFVADYLGFSVSNWSVCNAGTTGAFSKGSDGMLHVNDSKYGFDEVTTFGINATIQVYDADPASVATSDEVTIFMQPASRATVTILHRYWSVTDTKNGVFNENSGSEVVTESLKVITDKTYTFTCAAKTGFTAKKASETLYVTGDTTIIIDYVRNTYTLTLDAGAGTLPVNTKATYAITLYYGELTSLYDSSRTTGSGLKGVKADYLPKCTDYLFYSWYNGTERVTDEFAMPASNVTLTPDWVYAKEVYTFGTVRVDADTDQSLYRYTKTSDADWAKIYEYGNNALVDMYFYIQEIDEGYQEVSIYAMKEGSGYKFLYSDTSLETNGSKKGSESYYPDDKTISMTEVRRGINIDLGAHGSLEDDYYFNATITVTILPKY